MHQIARAAAVSLGTVSHVINDTATVREPLRQRVLAAVKSLGYEPNELSRGLRLNRTNIIGVIIPDITNPFFPGVVRGIEDVAYKDSYRLVLCNTDNDPHKEALCLGQLKSFLPAGILLIPAPDSTISKNISGPPVVCVDRRPDGWKGDIVTVANRDGAYKAAKHLIEMGHRQIWCHIRAVAFDQCGGTRARLSSGFGRREHLHRPRIYPGSSVRSQQRIHLGDPPAPVAAAPYGDLRHQ
jgi:DNA-binding LacI/PurR family transcriptional regulator